MSQHITTFCRICENQCGLKVTVDNDQIQQVEPDKDHVVSKGYACIKGLTFHHVQNNPDRLTTPYHRQGDSFEPTSWEQALPAIGEKIQQLRQQYGDDSIGIYFGNPISFSTMMPMGFMGLLKGLKSTKLFNTGSLDCNNKFAVGERMYGSGMAQTFPDIDHNQFLMIIGGNPAISKMSFINLPDPVKRIQAIIERGGQVVHLNPRRTETARSVGEQVFIRPDTDVFFLFAFLHEVLARKAVNQQRIQQHMAGFDKLTNIVSDWTPEKQAAVTGISAGKLRELVTAYLAADGAALYASTGINQGRNGTLAFWALEVINAITGNLDKTGGTLMGRGVKDFAKMSAKNPSPPPISRIGNTRGLMEALPTPLLADEILTPGEGQLKALIVISGNPLLTGTNSAKMARALQQLDLLVSIDLVQNETANYAHYLLPGTHFAERPDIPFTFFSFAGLMPVPWFQYTDPLVSPPGDARDEWWIVSRLAHYANAPLFGSRLFQSLLNLGEKMKSLPGLGNSKGLHHRLVSLFCRLTGMGSLRSLRQHPHGKLLEPITGDSYLGQRCWAKDGKVQLAPADLVALARQRLPATFAEEQQQPNALKLITKRERFSHNSWAHNDPAFIKGKRNTNYLYMHPDDAAKRQLDEGQQVVVSTASGQVEVPVTVSKDLMPGTVALPHGWGHQRYQGQRIAATTIGANANLLAADGPDAIEPISGMAHFNGITVEVVAAEGKPVRESQTA